MKIVLGAIIASIGLAQPALAEQITIRCTGTSVMTIFNPHGNGGTAGGPTRKEWIFHTDGRNISYSVDGGKLTAGRDLLLTTGGFIFCGAAADVDCEAFKKFPRSSGGTMTGYVANYKVDNTILSHRLEFLHDNVTMKTGFEAYINGSCDFNALEQLRLLRERGVNN